MVLLGLWLIGINTAQPGRDWPIAYFPLLNPIDLAIGFALFAAVVWWRSGQKLLDPWPLLDQRPFAIGLVAAALFIWANAIVRPVPSRR